jgi:hypothetical protein
MESNMSRFYFSGSTSWKRQPGVAKVLGKRRGIVEGSTQAATKKTICRKWHGEIKVFSFMLINLLSKCYLRNYTRSSEIEK